MRQVLALVWRFLVIAPPCLVVWWWFLPAYGHLTGRVSALGAGMLGEYPEYLEIRSGGLLNTGTLVILSGDGRLCRFPLGKLATNMAPYVALVFATPGLTTRRRLRALGLGAGLLLMSHVAYMALAFRFREAIQASPALPSALGEFVLMLPFVLWVVLVQGWSQFQRRIVPETDG